LRNTYPAKSNVAIPTTLVIANNVFMRSPCNDFYAWMSF
jgi:hypothetical protein